MAVRTKMRKEVTHTVVNAKRVIVDENGNTRAEDLPEETLLGNRSKEQAQRIMQKKHGKDVVVFRVQANTNTYEMEVEKFISLADLVVPKSEDEE